MKSRRVWSRNQRSPWVRTAIALAAVGATALGAVAIGAVAVGALAIGRLVVGSGRFRRLEIDELVIGRLILRDEDDA